MTILKGSLALVNYPFVTLPEDVVALMHRCYEPIAVEGMGQLTKLFDGFCSITRTPITYLSLSTHSFEVTVRGFLGALNDPGFVDITRPRRVSYAREFVRMLSEMAKEIPLLFNLEGWRGRDGWMKHNDNYWLALRENLDPQAVRFWNGWAASDIEGVTSYLSIAKIWISHGPEFAESIYKCITQHFIKVRRPRSSDLNAFLNFISARAKTWPAEAFKNPVQIRLIFLDYMLHFFTYHHEQGNDLAFATKSYAALNHTIESTMLASGIWAKPFAIKLPKPKVQDVPGAYTNTKKGPKGEIIKAKLITEVPCQVTDTQAIELIFKTIKSDCDILYRWAKSNAWKTSSAQKARDRLAKDGAPDQKIYATRANFDHIKPEDLCAAFKTHGFGYIHYNFTKRFGRIITKDSVNSILRLPSGNDLLPFQFLLVHEYPCITQAFLDKLELYNKNGELTGFIKMNGYYLLTGYKDRKGGKLSEMKIQLRPRDAVRVRQIIRCTQPLRDFLRSENNDSWRYLFIHSARGLTYPTRMPTINWNSGTLKTRHARLADEFSEFLDLPKSQIEDYICRISVTSLRASRAVILYIENNSLSETARALGHSTLSPALLARYLPEPILAFFQTRWIRAFQRGIIYHAMKDSKYLLQSSNFRTMDELHQFLANNALKDIPEAMRDPETYRNARTNATRLGRSSADNDIADRVMISVDVGILTALLSLEQAVSNSKRKEEICSKAKYWAKLTRLLINEIDESYEFDLKEDLATAKTQMDAKKMESLIYATAS